MGKEIKIGDVYNYIFDRMSKEYVATGRKEHKIRITYTRGDVCFYIIDGHPELGEQHFELGSYMAEHLELLKE